MTSGMTPKLFDTLSFTQYLLCIAH